MKTSLDKDDKNLLREYSELHSIDEWCEIFHQRYSPQLIEKFCKSHKLLFKDASGLLRRRYKLKEDLFKTWSESMAYVLGFIYATGTLSDGCRLECICSTKNKDVVDLVTNTIGYQDDVVMPSDPNVCKMVIVNKNIYNVLVQLGGINLNIFPLGIPVPSISHFIRGFFDANAEIVNNQIIFYGYNEFFLTLWDNINTYACTEGGVYDGIGRRLIFEERDMKRLSDFLYHKITTGLWSQRKRVLLEGS